MFRQQTAFKLVKTRKCNSHLGDINTLLTKNCGTLILETQSIFVRKEEKNTSFGCSMCGRGPEKYLQVFSLLKRFLGKCYWEINLRNANNQFSKMQKKTPLSGVLRLEEDQNRVCKCSLFQEGFLVNVNGTLILEMQSNNFRKVAKSATFWCHVWKRTRKGFATVLSFKKVSCSMLIGRGLESIFKLKSELLKSAKAHQLLSFTQLLSKSSS